MNHTGGVNVSRSRAEWKQLAAPSGQTSEREVATKSGIHGDSTVRESDIRSRDSKNNNKTKSPVAGETIQIAEDAVDDDAVVSGKAAGDGKSRQQIFS